MKGLIVTENIHPCVDTLIRDIFVNTDLKLYDYLMNSVSWSLNETKSINDIHCKYVITVGCVPQWIHETLSYRGQRMCPHICNEIRLTGFLHETVELFDMCTEEEMYLQLMNDILKRGTSKMDRTNVGTLSIFSKNLEFDLQNNTLPLLTTKKMFYRGILEELLWFIKGSTNSKLLEDKNINIWKGNSSKEFLEKRKLSYEEGELGPVYGFQWRYWGAKYPSRKHGIDQLQKIITTIRLGDVHNRRMILSAWNVSDLSKMALPPCHMMCQFYVSDIGLCCALTQRSGDVFLGVPFNIASYAILTMIVAHCTGLKPHRLIIHIGDAHIYNTHIESCKKQLDTEAYPFPTLHISENVKDIDDLEFGNFTLNDYVSGPSISAPMAV